MLTQGAMIIQDTPQLSLYLWRAPDGQTADLAQKSNY